MNGENGVIKIENRDYSALTATLKVITKCGWDYTTTPEAALQAVGASKGLASVIESVSPTPKAARMAITP